MDEAFVKTLLGWYRENARVLPWRGSKNPYLVWVSEIMLQQTRVEAVKERYGQFVAVFPEVQSLADSDEDVLLKLWEGLGYYSRARNMRKAARVIMERFGGTFPPSYEELKKLPGVGEYTAGAVSSIAFGIPVPAIDGNVLRVLARYSAEEGIVSDPAVRKKFRCRLLAVIPKDDPGTFNQALMELGATVCLPSGTPRCGFCPVAASCQAHSMKKETSYPKKAEIRGRKVEEKTVFVLKKDGGVFGYRRPPEGLLASLYQLPDTKGRLSAEQMLQQIESWGLIPNGEIRVFRRKHVFTHIEWQMLVCSVSVTNDETAGIPDGWIILDPSVHSLPTAYKTCIDI